MEQKLCGDKYDTIHADTGFGSIMEPSSHDVSHLLRQMRGGDKEAESRLWDRLYPELHRLAQNYRRGERPNHTLSPTALMHEAYLRLVAQGDKTWQSKVHFVGVAAQVMRRVLVDHARQHRVGKRAGAHVCIGLKEAFVAAPEPAKNILALDEALAELEKLDPQQSRVVELRFFGGLTEQETAEVLGIGVRTVTRELSLGKAWLYGKLHVRDG
jgi:RNA polymerase sigma-70 factor (ECF subfamily)